MDAVQVPAEGIPVVRGEAGGNTHSCCSRPAPSAGRRSTGSAWTSASSPSPDGAVGYLAHPSTATWVSARWYVLRRQREQADEIRMVAD